MTFEALLDDLLPDLQVKAHRIATEHGFWDGPEQDNIPTKIALIHEEISEALKDFREGRMVLQYADVEHGLKPEGFPIELADAMIRIMDLAERHEIDLGQMIKIKMAYNETRPHMHGRRV